MKQNRLWVILILILGFAIPGGFAYGEHAQTVQKKEQLKEKDIKKEKKDLPPPAKMSFKAFYQVARFIMTDDEKEIFKELVDPKEKIAFIREFWEKRDPTPNTEENESYTEFMDRIAYANKWFQESSRGRGWDTERGRILLQLGFPDRREFGEADDVVRGGRYSNRGKLLSSKRIPMEIWTYYKYSLRLVFVDIEVLGKLSLYRIPANLITTMDLVRSRLYLTNPDVKFKQKVRGKNKKVKVEYKSADNKITVKIPTKLVSFEERESDRDVMMAFFDVNVYVYHKNKKIDQVKLEKVFEKKKEELLEMENLEFVIPYTVVEKGKYFFDIIIKDRGTGTAFRRSAKFKHK